MLAAIQEQLVGLYRVDTGHLIDDFLITDPELARLLGQQTMLEDTDETVLVTEDEHGMALSVFLDADLLQRLDDNNPLAELRPEQLGDLWTAIEGVSHFTYLAWSAQQDKPVTLLELEMQAEVDKFVSTWLLALQQDDSALAERLHGWLFEDCRFHPELEADQLERYRAANDYAGRYCHRLLDSLRAGNARCFDELRRFYRLTQTHKISHIHAQAWGSA